MQTSLTRNTISNHNMANTSHWKTLKRTLKLLSAGLMLLSSLAQGAPTVELTAPTAGSIAPTAMLALTATATPSVDTTITKVEFYRDDTLLGSDTSSPYSAYWSNAAFAGTYSLTAKATDSTGAVTISAPVVITITGPATQVYYIQTDHLNTPRLITNSQNLAVWRNAPTTEAFGNGVVEDDPRSTGTHFTFNLRFPGQYFDKETNTAYNYFRDYDPQTGRYIQSDPIGLRGGINTYTYVGGMPVSNRDAKGLAKPKRPGLEVMRNDLECNSSEERACKLQCGNRGIDKCVAKVTNKLIGVKEDGSRIYGYERTFSCSCNDDHGENCPEENAFKKFLNGLTGSRPKPLDDSDEPHGLTYDKPKNTNGGINGGISPGVPGGATIPIFP